MKDRGIVLCPTLAANDAVARYQGWDGREPAPPVVEVGRASFKAARAAGVTICAGGDVGVFAHGENVRELELMQDAGMPAREVLMAVTSVNARAFHIDDRVGAIRAGLFADLVAVTGDPSRGHSRAAPGPPGDEGRQGRPRMSDANGFDLPMPHVIELTVGAADIDAYNHVNNAVYVTWCDRIAWDHSAALGLPLARCLEIDRGMAVVRTVIQYLRPASARRRRAHRDLDRAGGQPAAGAPPLPDQAHGRRRARWRAPRSSTSASSCRAARPMRWPPEFRERYVSIPEVAAASATLAPL